MPSTSGLNAMKEGGSERKLSRLSALESEFAAVYGDCIAEDTGNLYRLCQPGRLCHRLNHQDQVIMMEIGLRKHCISVIIAKENICLLYVISM